MLDTSKKDITRRMKIIQGQINKILSMVEEEAYCPDIMIQSLAVQSGLKQVESKLLESHLQTCVKHQMKSGKTDKAVKELLKIFGLSKKNK